MAQYKVIDISQYQTNVDYAKVAKEVDGVIIRIGYRGWGSAGTLCKDSQFDNHLKGAINNNIPYGFYFFSQATNAVEAKAEADYIYNFIKDTKPTYPIYIDIEDSGAPNNGGRADGNTRAEWTKVCQVFCDRVSQFGVKSGIYMNEYWANNKVNLNELSKYSKWIAKYGTNNGTAQTKPTVDYDGWQFTSVAKIDGINGGVDLSYFSTNFKSTTSKPAAKPVTPTVTYETYYVNCSDGLNYRQTPNGNLIGTYSNGTQVQIVKGSEQTVNGLVWVKTKAGQYVAKKYLSTTKPSQTKPTSSVSYNYTVNNTYTLQEDMKVRTGAGTIYAQKRYNALTADGKKNAYRQTYAVLKKGTKVTALRVIKNSNTDIWLQIPSGYVCAVSGNNVYIK